MRGQKRQIRNQLQTAKAIQTLLAKRIKSADKKIQFTGDRKLCSTTKEQISQGCIQAAWSMATENATAATTIDFVRMKSWLQFNDLNL